MSLFKVHILNEEGILKAKEIQTAFEMFLARLEDLCPEGSREFAIVKTKLEEASFFAKKAMAIHPVNQKEQV